MTSLENVDFSASPEDRLRRLEEYRQLASRLETNDEAALESNALGIDDEIGLELASASLTEELIRILRPHLDLSDPLQLQEFFRELAGSFAQDNPPRSR